MCAVAYSVGGGWVKEGRRADLPGRVVPSRRDLYMAGGLISVTSRILVVDMLTGNIPTKMITGMLVLHAER